MAKWKNNHAKKQIKRAYRGGAVQQREDIKFIFGELQVVRAINKDFNIQKHSNKHKS